MPPTDSLLLRGNAFNLYNSAGSHIIFQTSSARSNPSLLFQKWGSISQIQNTFLSDASLVSYCKVFFTFSLVSFHIGSSHSTLILPLPHIPSTPLSHKCLGFLFLSILIRCPNHLSLLLSNISVTGTLFSILEIWLFLILSLLDILLTVHLSIVYFSLFPNRYTSLFRLHIISAILFPLHVSGLTGPSSGGPNCTCSQWYSGVLSQRPHDRHLQRGEYHWLHVQFGPPDDGPVRPETCRGKRIAEIICRRKRELYRVGNKEK